MAKTKISEFSATPANNTDIDSINIAEGCAPSGINDAIRELMAQLKDFQTGAVGDSFNGPIGTSTAAAGAFTTLSASGTATLSGLTASTALALDASKNIVSVTNTGTGSNVLATSPTLVTPILGTPTSATLTNATGLPIATGVSGLGTGVATALAVNVGSSGAPLVNGGVLGTPSSGTLTNLTGLPLTTGVTGTLPTANGGTGLTSFTSGGVVYASSSSALATGSALTFDGTNFAVGTQGEIRAYNTANTRYGRFVTTPDGTVLESFNGAGEPLILSAPQSTGSIQFKVAGTEGMRLTSSSFYTASGINVGIGTSSPTFSAGGGLHISNATAANVRLQDTTTNVFTNIWQADNGSSSSFLIDVDPNNVGSGGTSFFINTAGTTKVTLNSAGNLGLGVTPSAWNSTFRALEVGFVGNNLVGFAQSDVAISSGSYYAGGGSSGWKYSATNSLGASFYEQYTGQHIWYNKAPVAHSAGDAISFTQAMTLDASGRLLVGTTSGSGATMFTVNQPAASTDAKTIVSVTTGTNAAFTAFVNTTVTTVGTENSSGGSLVSGSSAYSTVIANNGAYPISFGTNNTERARIDSSGRLLVGCTATDSSAQFRFQYTSGQNGLQLFDNSNSNNSTFAIFAIDTGSPANIGSIVRVGTTSAVVYNTTSDYRLKTVTGAVTGQGARIDALKPIDYQWKEGNTSARGFLAHEFQTVYPNSVSGEKDAVDANGNPKHQSMQAATSEVIADLVAEIQSLRQRLSAANL
jgi:hypothetical protein